MQFLISIPPYNLYSLSYHTYTQYEKTTFGGRRALQKYRGGTTSIFTKYRSFTSFSLLIWGTIYLVEVISRLVFSIMIMQIFFLKYVYYHISFSYTFLQSNQFLIATLFESGVRGACAKQRP